MGINATIRTCQEIQCQQQWPFLLKLVFALRPCYKFSINWFNTNAFLNPIFYYANYT